MPNLQANEEAADLLGGDTAAEEAEEWPTLGTSQSRTAQKTDSQLYKMVSYLPRPTRPLCRLMLHADVVH